MKKLITIGIPVYNEEKHIKEVLDSIVPDLEIIFQVIIFDNASTDATQSICLKYAYKYPEIIYRRNKTNIGQVKNAVNIMKSVKSKYYVQIGGHDVFPEGYFKMLLQKMEDNEDAVNAFGNIINRDRPGRQKVGAKYALRERELRSEDWFARFLSYISIQDFNATYYGLSKTEVMKEVFSKYDLDGLGGDGLIQAYMITKGKFYYVNTPPVKVNCRIGESKKENFKRIRNAGVKLPFNPYGRYRKNLLRIIRERKEKNEKELIKTTKVVMEKKMGLYPNGFIKFLKVTVAQLKNIVIH